MNRTEPAHRSVTVGTTPHPVVVIPLRQRRIAGIIGLVLMAFVIVVGIIAAHSAAITDTDLTFDEVASENHTRFLTGAASGIDWLFQPAVAVALIVVLTALVFVNTRNLWLVITFLLIVVVPYLTSYLVKVMVERHRPDPSRLAHPLFTESSFSYPSGHTTIAASLALACVLLLRGSRWHAPAAILAVLVTAAVAASRVYLGAHYPLDVVASVAWTVGTVSLVLSLWNGYVIPHAIKGRAR